MWFTPSIPVPAGDPVFRGRTVAWENLTQRNQGATVPATGIAV